MTAVDRRRGLEVLDRDTCLELLAAAEVGRLAIGGLGEVILLPINYALDGETVVFRTDPGTKLAGLAKSPAVCFQVDGLDPERHKGWSVLVKGRAHELTDPEDRHRAAERNLRYWSVGPKPHWIRIEPREVTGRRIYRSADDIAEGNSAEADDGDPAGGDPRQEH